MPETPESSARRKSVTIELDKRALFLAIIVIALVAGFAGGYWSSGSTALARQRQASAHSGCSFELPTSQEYIIAGLRCPEPNSNDTVIECHCEECHRIKAMVKDLLLQNRSTDQIRQEIVKRYGDRVKPLQ